MTHELGHALGLNNLPNDNEYECIMIQVINSSNIITYYNIINLLEFINSSKDVLNIQPVTYYLCFASANDGLDRASVDTWSVVWIEKRFWANILLSNIDLNLSRWFPISRVIVLKAVNF